MIDEAEQFDLPGKLKDHESPDAVLMGMELEQAVNSAIDGLPDELKAALTLREFEGLSYEEIAEILSCPIGTVRSRIFRAREAVDQRVEEQLGGESRL